jgi:hypothetical protein
MRAVERVMESLQQFGLLLRQDKALPSVVTIVAGGPVAGSWWGHPRSADIFRCLSDLQLQPDVLETKLIGGKVTYVHRRLWPALLAVAQAGEPWQMRGLSPGARALLQRIGKQGPLIASGPAARELQTQLLAHGSQVHTEAGHHETRLETWEQWSHRAGCTTDLSANQARRELESAAVALGAALKNLPWQAARRS